VEYVLVLGVVQVLDVVLEFDMVVVGMGYHMENRNQNHLVNLNLLNLSHLIRTFFKFN